MFSEDSDRREHRRGQGCPRAGPAPRHAERLRARPPDYPRRMRFGLSLPHYGFSLPSGETSFEAVGGLGEASRAPRVRFGLGLRPLLLLVREVRRGPGADPVARATHDARRDRLGHRPGSAGHPRALRTLPASGAPRQGGGVDRPAVRRPSGSRARGRVVRGGVRCLRLPVRLGGRAVRRAGGVSRGDAVALPRGARCLRRVERHPQRRRAGAGARATTSDVAGGQGGAEAPSLGRPFRRRLEHGVAHRRPRATRTRWRTSGPPAMRSIETPPGSASRSVCTR